MAEQFQAVANPEKRLFISLITRDISLADAIVDLTDNSVNAAMKSLQNSFSSSGDFHKLLSNDDSLPEITIKVKFDEDHVSVIDNAEGIDFHAAQNDVFRFGHSDDYHGKKDRLSVYGIGMKRALFKIGRKVSMFSDHRAGGFALLLDVAKWQKDKHIPWTFPLTKRPPITKTGTSITIRELNDEIRIRMSSQRFEYELIEKLSKVYSYFIGRVINISVNGKPVQRTDFRMGSNYSHDIFKSDGVDCSVTAGIASATGGQFLADAAGWFIFCNFRTVLYADKTQLTGWGGALPLFQPKHRPFLGIVSFTSAKPEALPWTTTKGSINEDNLAWQEAKLRMAAVAKPVIRFLDTRYTSEGTDIQPSAVARMSGPVDNVFKATISPKRLFAAAVKEAPRTVRVQYDAKKSELERVKQHYGRSNMSATEIGRKTFDYFLRNVADEK